MHFSSVCVPLINTIPCSRRRCLWWFQALWLTQCRVLHSFHAQSMVRRLKKAEVEPSATLPLCHTDRQIDRQTRRTERQADREADRETARHRNSQRNSQPESQPETDSAERQRDSQPERQPGTDSAERQPETDRLCRETERQTLQRDSQRQTLQRNRETARDRLCRETERQPETDSAEKQRDSQRETLQRDGQRQTLQRDRETARERLCRETERQPETDSAERQREPDIETARDRLCRETDSAERQRDSQRQTPQRDRETARHRNGQRDCLLCLQGGVCVCVAFPSDRFRVRSWPTDRCTTLKTRHLCYQNSSRLELGGGGLFVMAPGHHSVQSLQSECHYYYSKSYQLSSLTDIK